MNTDQLQYILLLITGTIAIVGTLIKTKSDKGNPHFYNLTKGGILLILLSVGAVSLNIIIQYAKNQSQLFEKQKQRDAFTRDSLVTANRYLFDSISHQLTVNGLLKQRQLDSNKIKTDSSRYGVTLNKLAEQLRNQQTTLGEISKILNPLFPLKVQFRFNVYEQSAAIIEMGNLFEAIRKRYPQGYKDEINYIDISKDDSTYAAISGDDLLNKKPSQDTLFYQLNAILIKACPDMHVEFYKLRKKVIKNIFTDFGSNVYLEFNSLPNWNFTYRYEHHNTSNILDMTITGLVNDNNIIQNLIYSINELNGTDVNVDFHQADGSKLPLQIISMDIYTGANFQSQYTLNLFNDENSISSASGDKIELQKKVIQQVSPFLVP